MEFPNILACLFFLVESASYKLAKLLRHGSAAHGALLQTRAKRMDGCLVGYEITCVTNAQPRTRHEGGGEAGIWRCAGISTVVLWLPSSPPPSHRALQVETSAGTWKEFGLWCFDGLSCGLLGVFWLECCCCRRVLRLRTGLCTERHRLGVREFGLRCIDGC